MTLMKDPSYWDDKSRLIAYLGEQLSKGRLALLLGAGVSVPFGLPNWDKLIDRMSRSAKLGKFAQGSSATRRAEAILQSKFSGKEDKFLDLVHSSLYNKVSIDLKVLTSQRLLAAIGSLVMASKRGSASQVINLNFDDILETYLEYYGFDVAAVVDDRHWAPNADVVVYHPHGFLPHDQSRRRSNSIVLSSGQFYKAMETSPDNAWRLLLLNLFRTHTVLHIGLSGEDMNIESLLPKVASFHPARPAQAAFVGVRFATKQRAKVASEKDIISATRAQKVYTHLVNSWDELPDLLFEICQKARELKRN